MKAREVCRCCLSEACFKDLSNEYYDTGSREVYSEMLLDTFSIEVSHQKGYRRLICEECIIKLQISAAFKHQVMRTEESILNGLINYALDVEQTKKRVTDDFIDHIVGDFDDGSCDASEMTKWQDNEDLDFDGALYTIKLEPQDYEVKKKKTKFKRKPTETSDFGDHYAECMEELNEEHIVGNKEKDKSYQKEVSSVRDKNKPPISQSQIDMKENSLKLINNSNLCLFDSLKTRFRCFYCKETFLLITDLRKHSAEHSNQKYLKMCFNRLRGMSYKNVDISSLSCKLCDTKQNGLNDLITHLTHEHKIEFASNNHLLIPYKVEYNYACVICNEEYNTFYRLSIHMNTHYTNNVCEICGVSYINRISLRMHVHSMHREKKCSGCPATFQNNYSRVKHMRKVHNSSSSKRYCLLCNKTFPYTYLLTEHKIQEHGVKRQVSQCGECGKSFLTPQNLRIHMRSVHIRERNHPCSYCGMRFFTKCDQRRHERTHQDVRSFSCEFCEGRFKSKDSLRRHLRRQHEQLPAAEDTSSHVLN